MYVSTNPLIENIRPPNSRKAKGRGLRYYYIVLPAGTVTDKKVSGLIPAYDNPDVRGVCKQSHISGLGIAGGNSGQVYSDIPIAVTGKSCIADAQSIMPEQSRPKGRYVPVEGLPAAVTF